MIFNCVCIEAINTACLQYPSLLAFVDSLHRIKTTVGLTIRSGLCELVAAHPLHRNHWFANVFLIRNIKTNYHSKWIALIYEPNAHDNLGLMFSIASLIAACFTCALVVLLCSRIVIRLCVPMELSLQILRISDNLKSLEVTKGVDEGRR